MNQERLLQVIVAPHVTEKSAIGAELSNQHVFKVVKNAAKSEVKAAVEQMFNVKVEAVRLMNVKGKTKRFRGYAGKRGDWKKAYVRLAEGSEISYEGAE
ncbi:ribosomal protein L23 [gamma proteobacterium HTCC5015]|nr:ribosomal protein L23 [gamma proteobacterium HTCC5015]